MDLFYLFIGKVVVGAALCALTALITFLVLCYICGLIQAFRLNYHTLKLNLDGSYKPIWKRPDHWLHLAWRMMLNMGSETYIQYKRDGHTYRSYPIPWNPFERAGWPEDDGE